MRIGRYLLITGPAGAGKTATADRWTRQQSRPAIHLSLDDVRDQVKSWATRTRRDGTHAGNVVSAGARTRGVVLPNGQAVHGERLSVRH